MLELLADGNTDFSTGQDASKVPERVPVTGYFAGINTTTAKGIISPRFALKELDLSFLDQTLTLQNGLTRTAEDIFRSGHFQAFAPYLVGVDYYVVVIICGCIYLIHQDTGMVRYVPIKDGSMIDPSAPRVHWSSTNKFLVIFDYPAYPVILDGYVARRSDPAKFETPISVLGAYNQTRLFIANAGNEYTGGDPTGSQAAPEAPITFQEVLTLGSSYFGQIFALPTNYKNDPITAMTFLPVVDTSTGIGPLVIATKNEIYTAAANTPRTNWTNESFASVTLFNAGIVGPRAWTTINSDLLFMSADGQVRSLTMSRLEQVKWSKSPMSREVQNWLQFYDRSLMPYTFMNYFSNRLFVAANPYRVLSQNLDRSPIVDVAFGGLAVLQFDNISSLNAQAPPAWDGLWTGVRPLDMVINNNRCFIIAKDSQNRNDLYELDPNSTLDRLEDHDFYIRSRLYTKRYDFQNSFQNKELHSLDLDMENLQGDFAVDVKFRPAQSETFVPWQTFTHLAPWRAAQTAPDGTLVPTIPSDAEANGFATQGFRVLNLGAPVDNTCDPVTQTQNRAFRKVDLQLTMEGRYWELHALKVKAVAIPQNENTPNCSDFGKIPVPKSCSDDWVIPSVNECLTTRT